MATSAQNHHDELLKELYELDPSLREHEVFLPKLIEDLANTRPSVTINPTFVADLRASLLTYKPTSAAPSQVVVSPFFWWLSRLAPVGVALALFVVLMPHETVAPTLPTYPTDVPSKVPTSDVPSDEPPATNDEASSRSLELFSTEAVPETNLETGTADVSIMEDMTMMAKDSGPVPLLVDPPLASTSLLTVATLTVPVAGWVVVHEDPGGELGPVLHSSRYNAGVYTTETLTLTRPLAYPELVTLVVYTDTATGTLATSNETIQTDPVSGMPLMATVPVVSELEIEIRD